MLGWDRTTELAMVLSLVLKTEITERKRIEVIEFCTLVRGYKKCAPSG